MRLFVNPSGQQDNVGDSVLRRPYLAALRREGTLNVLLTGAEDYNSGLGVQPTDRVWRSKRRWLLAAASALVRGDGVIALNAGEIVPSAFRRQLVWILPLLLLARSGRRPVVACGVGVRVGSERSAGLVRWILAHVSYLSTREPNILPEARVQPDWAFVTGEESAAGGNRSLLALSLRGDRPEPTAEWYASVRALVRRSGLTPVVVVQVRRDRARCQQLASEFGARLHDWSDEDHARQEHELRVLYGRCAGVVSDRIHVLIIGWTQGAAPLGLVPRDDRKVRQTFWFADDAAFVGVADGTEAEQNAMLDLLGSDRVARGLHRARQAIADVEAEIHDLLRRGRGRGAAGGSSR